MRLKSKLEPFNYKGEYSIYELTGHYGIFTKKKFFFYFFRNDN